MQSVEAVFTIILRDWNFIPVAIFDQISDLSYNNSIFELGSCTFSLQANDPRIDLFNLDYFIDIRRSVPGCNVDPYCDFFGFVRGRKFSVSSNGQYIFSVTGVGLEYLLQGAMINYHAATIRSYKLCSANRAILEYVHENCGEFALKQYERFSDAVIPNLIIDDVVDFGPEWEGDRAFENLLDTILDIAKFSSIDFRIYFDEKLNSLRFSTFISGYGKNRTTVGISNQTGRNSYNEFPVVFSIEHGNISELTYDFDRTNEGNIISVLGESELSTRHVQTVEKDSRYDSPYNRRELSRSQTGFENEMKVFGEETLNSVKSKHVISIVPISQPACLYGKHYGLGDWISVSFRDSIYHRRITSISNSVQLTDNISVELTE